MPPQSVRLDRIRRGIQTLIFLVIGFTPLLVAPHANNPFRLPKTLFFQASMLLIGAVAGACLLTRLTESSRARDHRIVIMLAAAAVCWTCTVSMLAVQPATARYASLTALTYALLFVLTILFVRGGPMLPLMVLLLPAAANSILTVFQALHLWSPIHLENIPLGRLNAIGLLGNPDYVGAYLIVPCVAALAGALAFRRHRTLFILIFVVVLSGIFFAQSVTAVITIAIALLSFVFVIRSRAMRIAIATLLAALALGISVYGPTRERAVTLTMNLYHGELLEFSSFRLPAFAVAVRMFQERPLFGVGPGGYESRYMSYKLANDERYPQWITIGNTNFGESHNDHLQLLAEAGVPGYALFLAALGSLAWLSFRTGGPSGERAEFARLFGFPAAVGFATVALAQFPLYLTECAATAIFAAALAHLWRSESDIEATAPENHGPARASLGAIAKVALAIGLMIASAMAAYRLCWLRYQCELEKKIVDRRLEIAFRLTTGEYERQALGRSAMDRLRKCLSEDPYDYETLYYFGNAADAAGLKSLALSSYQKALALNERPEIYATIAVLQFQLGQPEEAQRSILRACLFQLSYAERVEDTLQRTLYAAVKARKEHLLERAAIGTR